jgi:small-conductance mechanosensitive channel/CRP-like cAMP-binding protein
VTGGPWLVLPLAFVLLLALARAARLQPLLRPLVLPMALLALVLSGLSLAGEPLVPESGPLALVSLLPILVLGVRALAIVFELLFRRSQGAPPPSLLGSLVSVLLYGLGGGIVARYWFGVELTPVLATSAVVGAVVGLALQDTLGNLFAGIALHTAAPFRAGDWVHLGPHEGRVEEISWRAMRLRTWSDDLLTVPNSEVARSAILNFSQPAEPHSRLVTVGVNYQTPPSKVISVLAHLLEDIPGLVKQPPPRVRMLAFKDFAIEYEIRYFLQSYEDYRRIEGEICRLIWYHFRRHGIEIPFPVRNVYLRSADEDQHDASTSRLERALRAIDLFRPLSDDDLRLAASRFRHLRYAARERLIAEGEPGDSFFVIDRGEVEVSKQFGRASRPLARLLEGQFFGEMALLTGEPRSASVTAATDVDVFSIDKAGFHDVLAKNPAIAEDISTILSERQEALSQAQGDLTARYEGSSRGQLKQHLLERIRSYFGL